MENPAPLSVPTIPHGVDSALDVVLHCCNPPTGVYTYRAPNTDDGGDSGLDAWRKVGGFSGQSVKMPSDSFLVLFGVDLRARAA